MPFGLLAKFGGLAFQGSQAKAAARANRRFQERMSNSAYQRSMADMRKAGLNPILAYQQGGANTPGGSMALTPDYGSAGDTMITGKQKKEEQKNLGSQRDQIKQQIELAVEQTASTAATAAKTRKETELLDRQLPEAMLKGALAEKILGPLLSGANQLKSWVVPETTLNTAGETYQEQKERERDQQQSKRKTPDGDLLPSWKRKDNRRRRRDGTLIIGN